MLDKGKPAIYWGIFTEEGYGSMPARGRRGPASAEGTMYRAPTSVGRSLGGQGKRWRPKGTPLQGQVRRVGTMYRAPTKRTGLKTRHYKGREKDGALKGSRYKCLFGAEGEEILGAFDGILEAAEELLEVFAALDEIDVGGVDDEEVGGGVAEEEMFVGAGDFLDVFGGDVGFVAGRFLGDARAEDFGLGLEIDDQIGSGNVRGKGGVIALVELQLFVVEIEVGEDAVFLHEEVREDRAGSFDGEGFAEAFLALEKEVHLGAERGARLGVVEIGEEGIVFAIVDAAGVEAFGEDLGEGGFADAQRAFDDDEAGRLRTSLRSASALGCGRVVGRHRWNWRPRAGVNLRDYSRVILQVRCRSRARRCGLDSSGVGLGGARGNLGLQRCSVKWQGGATNVKTFSQIWPSTAVLKAGNVGAREGYQAECDQWASAT